MLVLTRRTDEEIVLGDDIVITVLAVEKDKVKLGIRAPRKVRVLRKELLDAVQAETVFAAQHSSHTTSATLSQVGKILSSLQDSQPETKSSTAEKDCLD